MRPFHNVKSVYAEHSIDNALQAGQLTADDARVIRALLRRSRLPVASGSHERRTKALMTLASKSTTRVFAIAFPPTPRQIVRIVPSPMVLKPWRINIEI
jgi:hypothetical protein